MIRHAAVNHPPQGGRPDLRAVGAVAVFAYFVVFGDLAWRDIPVARIASGLLAAGVVLLYVVRAAGRADRIDRNILLALLVFILASIFSRFPRQSFDSVLAALLYVAALFVAREVLARDSARRIFIAGLIALSALLTLATATQMIVPFVEWWGLTDWGVPPPLDLKALPQPWAFRYEITLLLLLLYPSWWIGSVTKIRATAAVVIGLLILVVCVIVGSRTVWLAAGTGIGAAVLSTVRRGFRWDLRRAVVLTGVVCLVIATLFVSGFGTAIGERVFHVAPIAARASEWGSLLGAWAERPLVGQGPGSFPWVLQLTGYFDTTSFAPRHADSGVVQLVVESGLIGLLAALIVLATVVPAVFRGRSRAARFALVACLVAGIGLNPAESAFLTAMTIAWVAFGAPRESETVRLPTPGQRTVRLRAMSLGAVAIIGIAFGATIIAALSYSSARRAITEGDFRGADASFGLASILDPSLAIYPRQLGTLRLLSGDFPAAVISLERATGLNPSDDLAWRVLGLAYAEVGDRASSKAALERAIEVQRSDPTNLLLMASTLRDEGDEAATRAVLSEIAQAWPMIVAAPGWTEFVTPFSTGQTLEAAHDRWVHGLPSPESLGSQPLLLGVMIGLAAADLDDQPARMSTTLRAAYVAVMRCDQDAGVALRRAKDADRRQATYWALAVRLAQLEGGSSRDYQRLYKILTSDYLLSDRPLRLLNPLHENDLRGSSADAWGYRRPPIDWPDGAWDLPSPLAGFTRWHREPTQAVRDAGLEDTLGACL